MRKRSPVPQADLQRRRALKGLLAAIACAAAAETAKAQDWPTRPIRIIVSYAPGGVTDVVARAVAQPLSEILRQSVIVENRPGAAGVIGTELVAGAAPDGYTLLMLVDGNTMMPSALKSLKHDPIRSFSAISQLGQGSLIIVVHPSLPVADLAELISLAKSQPDLLSFATPGKSGPQHLAFESIKQQAGFRAEHIPYKGGAQAVIDVLSGQVKIGVLGMAPVLPHIRSGRLRPLAVTGRRRSALLPEVPTVAQSGLPDFEMAQWQGLVAPAGTPRAILERLNAELRSIMANPAVTEKLTSIGMDNTTSPDPDTFAAMIARETRRWPALFAAADLYPE